MGTRNLTMVINKEGETKVAQYGQWDGHPSGQGVEALQFLHECDLNKFNESLRNIVFITQEEAEEINEMSDWLSVYPWLSRDLGAKILDAVYSGKFKRKNYPYEDEIINCEIDKLQDRSDFANDSLFCEWAYVVDLSKNTFEVYEGFVKEPIKEDERFYAGKSNDSGYYPIKMVKSFDLSSLPSVNEFLSMVEPQEEE